jgi:hypothetical protein
VYEYSIHLELYIMEESYTQLKQQGKSLKFIRFIKFGHRH